MSMRGAVAGCVVLMCLVAMLSEITEAHITFFGPKEMMLMKEREGRKGMEPRSEDGQFDEATIPQLPEVVTEGNPDKIVEIAVRLSAKQLDHMAPVLEEIIHEIAEEHEKAK
ncbi:motilin-like isoform 2-T2 [Polymixia lowei]